ncbi:histidine phosphatase family protein [Catenovulum sp. 2E275]|uniref:histidine phosphatase family protein n=1 Tax=Catenovulum sp. 2E275 TaxID=2980497 RepID=UPI0021D2B0FA|nr:histidine phosphatase family protein [Catenovulum sp. 2E275]MCU4674650.1 histidine phosphatase family protein [Catenovulum sp. 2E275]
MTNQIKPSRFTLLRHGSVAGRPALYGQTNVALSDQGLKDMYSAVEILDKAEPIDKIYSSPLLRCAMFAEAYGESHNHDIYLDHRLSEMDFGRFDGIPYDRLRQHWDKLEAFWANPYKNTPPEGERLKQFGIRVKSIWNELQQENQGQHYLLVCHGGVIRIILASILDIDWKNAHWFSRLKVDYASISQIEIGSHKKSTPIIKCIGAKPAGLLTD